VIQRFIIVSKHNFSTSWLRGYTYFLISAGNASNSITSNSGPFSSSSRAQITKSPWKCLVGTREYDNISPISMVTDENGNPFKPFFPHFPFPLFASARDLFIHFPSPAC
jgi:hypothetical protein